MAHRFVRCSLALPLTIALLSTAHAQPVPAAPQAGAGQTGILIGRPAAATAPLGADKAAYKANHKDALKAPPKEAYKSTQAGLARPSAGTEGIMMPPAGARTAGGQEPSQGGTGGQKHTTTQGIMMPPGGARTAGGQDPSQGGTGGQKRPAGAVGLGGQPTPQLAGQGANRARHDGQAGSGIQNPLGVQVREGGQVPVNPRAATVPGADLVGQPNPAASNAAKALR